MVFCFLAKNIYCEESTHTLEDDMGSESNNFLLYPCLHSLPNLLRPTQLLLKEFLDSVYDELF